VTRALALAAALAIGGALAPSCSAAGLPLSIAYLAAWDDEGVRIEDDGTWTTTTDRGFEVHVLDGSLATFAAALVPCDDTDAVAALRVALFPAVAHAGHVQNADPSQIEPYLADAIAPGAATSLGAIVVDDAGRYCRAHYLVTGAVDASTEVPTRAPSLTVAFEAYDAEGTLVRTASLSTTVATGVLDTIDVPSAGSAIEVTYVRPLATLFDGIDLADPALGDADVARAMLLTIARATRVVVTEATTE
jgi:hypothetical protein